MDYFLNPNLSKFQKMITWKLNDFLEPAWTNPDDFLTKFKDNFEDLISFSNSLEQFSSTLKSQLTTIIHDDYNEFVSISKQLIQLGDTMNSLIKSLHSAEKDVMKASEELEISTQSFQSNIDKLQNIRIEYSACSLALEAIENLQSIESQLKQVDLNIYIFFDISIGFAVAKAKIMGLEQPSERKPIEIEFNRLQGIFQSVLKTKFLEFLKKKQKEDITIIFNTAIMSGCSDCILNAFHDLTKEKLLQQIEKKIEDDKKYKRSTGSMPNPNSNIIFNMLINYLQSENSDMKFLNEVSPQSFDFMINSFWEPVTNWIDTHVIFPIGEPAEQYQSYKKVKIFFRVCQNFCRTNEAVQIIRNSPQKEKIFSKLRLDIYSHIISNKFLGDANKMFEDFLGETDIEQDTNESNSDDLFFMKFTRNFLNLYQKLFANDVFIEEQAKNFAIIAMKLILSLNKFALSCSSKFHPYFVSDLIKIGSYIFDSTPIFLQQAMQLAIDSMKKTSEQIRSDLISHLTEKCVKHLKYIGNLNTVGNKNVKAIKPSEEATASINVLFDWIKNSRDSCSDLEFLTTIVNKILEEFYEQSSNHLSSLQSNYETIKKFRQTTSTTGENDYNKTNIFSLENVQKQLKLDLDYIANLARSKNVKVDSFPIYQKIMELLSKDFSDESSSL